MRNSSFNLTQQLKVAPQLLLSPKMQQALKILQLPILEISTLVEQEIAQNPLLEKIESLEEDPLFTMSQREGPFLGKRESSDQSLQTIIENTLPSQRSLFEELMEQAVEAFEDPSLFSLAEILIGHIDQKGFLSTSLEEIALYHDHSLNQLEKVLLIIQTFDPPGVGAKNVQEALLLQLRRVGKQECFTYRVFAEHYDDLINNRLSFIAKKIKRSIQEVQQALDEAWPYLSFTPAGAFSSTHYISTAQEIVPDVHLQFQGEEYSIEINERPLPLIQLNPSYLKLLSDTSASSETKEYLHEKLSSGRWLMHCLFEREKTLYRLTDALAELQRPFFTSPQGILRPLKMGEVAEKLDLHESTIARAIADKYLNSPRGILPFRYFFTQALATEEGSFVSNSTVKDLLHEFIKNENPRSPLSDQDLCEMVNNKGISCARRTIAKYRQELGLGNAAQRKRF